MRLSIIAAAVYSVLAGGLVSLRYLMTGKTQFLKHATDAPVSSEVALRLFGFFFEDRWPAILLVSACVAVLFALRLHRIAAMACVAVVAASIELAFVWQNAGALRQYAGILAFLLADPVRFLMPAVAGAIAMWVASVRRPDPQLGNTSVGEPSLAAK